MNRIEAWLSLPLHRLLPLAFFLIGLLYWYAVPNFEASDTIQHVSMIKWIAENGALPLQSGEHEHLYGQEASQPPLFYIVNDAGLAGFGYIGL